MPDPLGRQRGGHHHLERLVVGGDEDVDRGIRGRPVPAEPRGLQPPHRHAEQQGVDQAVGSAITSGTAIHQASQFTEAIHRQAM